MKCGRHANSGRPLHAINRRMKTRKRPMDGAATTARTPHRATHASMIRISAAAAAGAREAVTARAAAPCNARRSRTVSIVTNQSRSTRHVIHVRERVRQGLNRKREREV